MFKFTPRKRNANDNYTGLANIQRHFPAGGNVKCYNYCGGAPPSPPHTFSTCFCSSYSLPLECLSLSLGKVQILPQLLPVIHLKAINSSKDLATHMASVVTPNGLHIASPVFPPPPEFQTWSPTVHPTDTYQTLNV